MRTRINQYFDTYNDPQKYNAGLIYLDEQKELTVQWIYISPCDATFFKKLFLMLRSPLSLSRCSVIAFCSVLRPNLLTGQDSQRQH